MSTACFLGVDGGGSKTGFLLIDGDGRELARHQMGSSYFVQIGMAGLRTVLAEGIDTVATIAGIASADITHAFFGLPAYGEDGSARARLEALPEEVLGHRRYTCGNDMVCAWAGSLAGADGINIVVGTGSIGYGERQGRTVRAGGWGYLLGDEGSGYWIALRALTLFTHMSDGRAPKGPLYEIIRSGFGLARDLDACALTSPRGAFSTRERIATLCPLVARAAREGDTGAAGIFWDAAVEVSKIADAVRAGLCCADDEIVPVSCSGGALDAGTFFRAAIESAITTRGPMFRFTAPVLSPLAGAVLMAAKRAGTPLSEAAIRRLPKATAHLPSTHTPADPSITPCAAERATLLRA